MFRPNSIIKLPFKHFFLISLLSFSICLPVKNLYAQSIKDTFMEGLNALENTDYDKAVERFELVLKMKSDFAPAYNFLGIAYKGKGKDIFEIISYFERAIELDPHYALAYENLGKAYYGLGNFDKALKYCLKATQLDPNLVTAQLSLGWIYLLGQSEPKSAIKYFKRVVDKNQTPYACLGLGIAYFQNNQFPLVLEMITHLRKMGEEKYAVHLENMVREGRYIAPMVEGMSLQLPQKRKGVLVDDETNNYANSGNDNSLEARRQAAQDIKNMQVYLKGKLPEDSQSPNANEPANISGAERIKALQRNSQSKGSPFNY